MKNAGAKVIWTPSIAPSGLTVYSGTLFPQWQGNLLAWGFGLSRCATRPG
ncbi:PQQ-dependent sugar dehydrogenase [Roseofilum sp. BLCC_M114]|uniref:PQQ-dependent sugar dehydrogenase n=1 Tax=Roseofilum capinflatum BLCC-M114 TaxID=3022440 RepID=A0ABT7BBZ5_9CYAN|nr:PQQ-dependent sugar dehydrogenase [Roseofilum capinflatum BLCC-M114]